MVNGNSVVLSSSNVSYNTRTITASYSIANDDYFVGVDTNYTGIVVTLPTLASTNNGRIFVIKDLMGLADVNQIIVSASSGEQIDLEPFTTLDIDHVAITVYKDTTGWFIF